ncbi:TIGR01906 family membrane protein [Candidatus Woesearchaeota archaeon]|nr:TIGR01906 family membrane protein [Candidatus Woesearchaeota archaeon]
MKKRKIRKEKIKFNILITSLVPLLILLLSFRLLAFDTDFYEKEFNKNNVYEIFNEDIVHRELNNLFNYFINNKELNTNFFNQKEKIHLEDVKILINGAINLLMILSFLFFIALIYYYKTKKIHGFFNSLIFGGLLSLFYLIIILFLALFNFNGLFLNFHLVMFDNDYWMLNPETDNLIVLFPAQFFYDAVIRIVIYSAIISLIFIGCGFYIKKRFKA